MYGSYSYCCSNIWLTQIIKYCSKFYDVTTWITLSSVFFLHSFYFLTMLSFISVLQNYFPVFCTSLHIWFYAIVGWTKLPFIWICNLCTWCCCQSTEICCPRNTIIFWRVSKSSPVVHVVKSFTYLRTSKQYKALLGVHAQ